MTSRKAFLAILAPRLAYVEARVKEGIAYRFNLFFQLLNPVLFLVLYSALWQAIYNGRAQVDGISSGVMGTYIVLSAAHTVLNRDDLVRLVRGRVRTGQVGVDLTSPLPLLEQQFLSQIGHLLVRVPVLPPILAVGVVAAGLTGPDSPATLGMYLLSMVLGWLVNCCIWLLIVAVSFWTLELGGMTFLYTVVSQFLSGAIIPLWFMPEDFHRLLEWLPHQATLFTPIAIYLGTTEGIGGWRAIASKLAGCWCSGARQDWCGDARADASWSRAVEVRVVAGARRQSCWAGRCGLRCSTAWTSCSPWRRGWRTRPAASSRSGSSWTSSTRWPDGR